MGKPECQVLNIASPLTLLPTFASRCLARLLVQNHYNCHEAVIPLHFAAAARVM